MPRGGFFVGGDYLPYMPGNLSKSSATSRKEFIKQDSVFCPNCKREVPKKDKCIFCDSILS